MRHKDGHIGWIESMCVPIYDDDSLIGALGINRDISKRISEAKCLELLAHYDHLTKIPNRYLLFERLKYLIAQSERNSNTFSLLYIDIDHFKIINDTKGHSYGIRFLSKPLCDSNTVFVIQIPSLGLEVMNLLFCWKILTIKVILQK